MIFALIALVGLLIFCVHLWARIVDLEARVDSIAKDEPKR